MKRNVNLGLVIFCVLVVLGMGFTDAWARGRGGGGGMRGGGMRSGGLSRSGPARSGSMRGGSTRGAYDSGRGSRYGGSSNSYDRSSRERGARSDTATRSDSGSWSRETQRGGTLEGSRSGGAYEGTYTGPRGETIDYQGTAGRTDDGFKRSGSWNSSTGASGTGSADVNVKDGKVTGADRSRHTTTASGETIDRNVSSERDGNVVQREGDIKTSTGIDAETESVIKKTDDGFAAEVYAKGDDREGVVQVVKDGDRVYARGVKRDGDDVTWGRMNCNSGRCTGGRVTADIDHYDHYPYYYYPYYYAYYACPPGQTTVVVGSYGTNVYSCSTTVVISTTVVYGSSTYLSNSIAAGDSKSGSAKKPEAFVTSSPVLMYEVSPKVVVYSTTYEPKGLYAAKSNGRFYWIPGAASKSKTVTAAIEQAQKADDPTANATVITYTIADRLVYLTNERPAESIHAEQSDGLYAWMPGVTAPDASQKDALATALTAHRQGGAKALDAEVRTLEEGREPPAAAG